MSSGTQPSKLAEALARASQERRAGKPDAAAAIYQEVLQADPANHVAMHGLGLIAYRGKDYQTAAAWISRALAVSPGEANYYNTLGACRRAMGMAEEAVASYQQAIALQPNSTEAPANMGNALRELGRYEEAIASYERALALKPVHATLLGLGNALAEAGRPREALAHYRAALALQPDHPDTHFAYSVALLACGELAEGWREYEWRHESHARPMGVYRKFSQPKWNGEALDGRCILLYAEQGFGDTLQFLRYAPMVARRGGRVIVECRPELVRLVGGMPAIEAAVARGKPLPAFDVHHALLSLPLLFQTTLEAIPAQIPYIGADADDAAEWRERLAGHSGANVGIAWSSSPTSRASRRKACPLAAFAPLAHAGARFYSLQKGPASGQVRDPATGIELTDWTDELQDFADTAALVENLDLVITVDTAVAHLAGAMGKPVWLLLSTEGDWRWLLDREDSPWYPTLRIFRQRKQGDWTELLSRVAAVLREEYFGTSHPREGGDPVKS